MIESRPIFGRLSCFGDFIFDEPRYFFHTPLFQNNIILSQENLKRLTTDQLNQIESIITLNEHKKIADTVGNITHIRSPIYTAGIPKTTIRFSKKVAICAILSIFIIKFMHFK